MAGAKKTFKDITSKKKLKERFAPDPTDRRELEKGFANPVSVMSESVDDIGAVFTPEIPEEEEQTIIPIPDERTAEKEARKRRARKGGSGRSSTILTEGLGG